MERRAFILLFLVALSVAVGCDHGGKSSPTSVAITNKIASLPAGQTYQFNVSESNGEGAGFTVKLYGQGTLLPTAAGAVYLAPSTPPLPNSVTVNVTAANGSGASDFNSFKITLAPGPVVDLSPDTITATAGGPPVTLNVLVTQDNPSNVLSAGVSGSSDCNGTCGSFGPFSGAPGLSAYTVQYMPPPSVTVATQQRIKVFSSLANSTPGTAYVTINP
jgi:hypothetical protein